MLLFVSKLFFVVLPLRNSFFHLVLTSPPPPPSTSCPVCCIPLTFLTLLSFQMPLLPPLFLSPSPAYGHISITIVFIRASSCLSRLYLACICCFFSLLFCQCHLPSPGLLSLHICFPFLYHSIVSPFTCLSYLLPSFLPSPFVQCVPLPLTEFLSPVSTNSYVPPFYLIFFFLSVYTLSILLFSFHLLSYFSFLSCIAINLFFLVLSLCLRLLHLKTCFLMGAPHTSRS